jgi:hypothetical protein
LETPVEAALLGERRIALQEWDAKLGVGTIESDVDRIGEAVSVDPVKTRLGLRPSQHTSPGLIWDAGT